MHPDVRNLLSIQEIDQKLARARRDLDSIPKETARREQSLVTLRADRDHKHQSLKDADVQQRTSELSIQEADEEIKKLEARLNTVKNNAEYQATLLQIESVRTERTRLEDDGLGLIERIDELRSQVVETDSAVADSESVHAEYLAEAQKLEAERRVQVDSIATGRDGLIDSVSPELRGEYERLFSARESLAVCAAEAGTCTGCYSSIPPNLQVKLQSGSSVVQCDSCQRILYLPE